VIFVTLNVVFTSLILYALRL